VFTVAVLCARCGTSSASIGACPGCGAALELPAIDITQLALLDELGTPPAGSRARSELPAPPLAPPPAAFGPPPELHDAPIGVERSTRAIRIEDQWQRERSARHAAAALPPPPPRPPIGGILAAVLLIAAVAIGVVAIVRLAPHAAPPRADHGVSIRIIARDPTEVAIDGHVAGKTPVTLQRPRGTQPLVITTARNVRQIIPDHDQVIDVSP